MLQKIWAKSFMATQGHEMEHLPHRRRIYIKEKAKVIASVWGQEFIQFPRRDSFFAQGRFEE